LKKFVEDGGAIVAFGGSAVLGHDLGLPVSDHMVESQQDGSERPLPGTKYYIPGSILSVSVDNTNPLAYGFDKTVDVSCNSTDNPNTFRFCNQSGTPLLGEPAVSIPYLNEFKFNANVPLWYGVDVSASFQSYAGAIKAAAGGLSWTVSRGVTRFPSDCSVPGCTPGGIVLPSRFAGDPAITLQLAAPGTRYEPRWNQLDFSLSKTFRFSGKSVRAQVTLFNALNANPVLTETTSLGSNVSIAPYLTTDPNTGGTPISILQPRIIQLGAQIRF